MLEDISNCWVETKVRASIFVLGVGILATPLFAVAQEAAIPVRVVRVSSTSVHDEVPLSGTVAARRASRLSPRVEGYVHQILVDAGDEVEIG